MRRGERAAWVLEKLLDLLKALVRGDRVAVALLTAFITGVVLYWVVTHRRTRGAPPGPEETWVVPSLEEVSRVVGSTQASRPADGETASQGSTPEKKP
jgi:hypothetical protein